MLAFVAAGVGIGFSSLKPRRPRTNGSLQSTLTSSGDWTSTTGRVNDH
jgi:hypothetical protein